ncbi:hypothetical protein SAMN05444166_2392 [Singulisphaera sp. GP187]|uniref:hypothetical protein n=1 Tax=Singulisphaera sp. GP187 TaxID=1882752 RepID=UPI00092C0A98|nr:hypothetical protein [Singulisphaera sp. GP187]SIO09008.1 hypothetical protein SAMN05444166_2392 [Singulisphaera sp. GP187]
MAYDQTLVQIRERSFLELLDLALVVLRRRPFTIGCAAVAGAAPFAIFNAWLTREQDLPFIGYLFVLALEIPWATAPLTIVLGGLMFAERRSVGRVLKTMMQSFVSMVLFQFILRGFLLVTVLLIPLIPVRMAFLNEVILLERGRWRNALRRSSTLCEPRGGELLGQSLAQFCFGTLFVLAFWAGSGALIQALFSSELTWEPTWNDLVGPRFHIAIWVAIEFFAIARFFNYIDQRIRLEGWEVELRLRAVGRTLEDARRW